MMQKLISLGSKFRRKFDCSHIVIEGKNVFVSLTNSFDNVAGIILDDTIHQTHQTSRNIEVVRSEGRAGIANVISACCIFPDAAAWEAMSAIHGVIFGDNCSTAISIIPGPIVPQIKMKIEVTARWRRI